MSAPTETLMDASTARDLVKQIKRGVSTAGEMLLRLKRQKGWQALGYSSWLDCAKSEFDFSRSHLFELTAKAEIEEEIAPKSDTSDSEKVRLTSQQHRALSVVEEGKRKEVFEKAKAATGLDNPPAAAIEEVINNLPPKQDAKDQEPPKVEKADEIIVKVTKHCSGSKVLDKINGLVGDYMAHWPDNLDALERNLQAHLNRIQKDKPSNVVQMQKASAV